jgi:uncharacterized SAM-binding protein YcdF (DUF218 family)
MVHLSAEDLRDFEILYRYLCFQDSLPAQADAIVACGSGPRVDMAEVAAQLYHQSIAPLIVVSGFAHPRYGVSEAALLHDTLLNLQVPVTAVIVEPHAQHTGQNITLSDERLQAAGVKAKRVILVSHCFTTRRVKATAIKQWSAPQPVFHTRALQLSFATYLEQRQREETAPNFLRSLLGEYFRLLDGVEQGFSVTPSFDPAAHAAYHRLRTHGHEIRERVVLA